MAEVLFVFVFVFVVPLFSETSTWQRRNTRRNPVIPSIRRQGVGGVHEAEEPLQLCISVLGDQACFDEACARAERGIMQIHTEYEAFLSTVRSDTRVTGSPDDLA